MQYELLQIQTFAGTLNHYFSISRFWIYIYSINSFYAAHFMFSYYHLLLPLLFLDLFVTSRHIHNYNTRTSPHFRSHACRTNPKQFTILFQGPKIWNSLRKSLTVNFLLQSFKKCWMLFGKIIQNFAYLDFKKKT